MDNTVRRHMATGRMALLALALLTVLGVTGRPAAAHG
jgi:hypothetical protein